MERVNRTYQALRHLHRHPNRHRRRRRRSPSSSSSEEEEEARELDRFTAPRGPPPLRPPRPDELVEMSSSSSPRRVHFVVEAQSMPRALALAMISEEPEAEAEAEIQSEIDTQETLVPERDNQGSDAAEVGLADTLCLCERARTTWIRWQEVGCHCRSEESEDEGSDSGSGEGEGGIGNGGRGGGRGNFGSRVHAVASRARSWLPWNRTRPDSGSEDTRSSSFNAGSEQDENSDECCCKIARAALREWLDRDCNCGHEYSPPGLSGGGDEGDGRDEGPAREDVTGPCGGQHQAPHSDFQGRQFEEREDGKGSGDHYAEDRGHAMHVIADERMFGLSAFIPGEERWRHAEAGKNQEDEEDGGVKPESSDELSWREGDDRQAMGIQQSDLGYSTVTTDDPHLPNVQSHWSILTGDSISSLDPIRNRDGGLVNQRSQSDDSQRPVAIWLDSLRGERTISVGDHNIAESIEQRLEVPIASTSEIEVLKSNPTDELPDVSHEHGKHDETTDAHIDQRKDASITTAAAGGSQSRLTSPSQRSMARGEVVAVRQLVTREQAIPIAQEVKDLSCRGALPSTNQAAFLRKPQDLSMMSEIAKGKQRAEDDKPSGLRRGGSERSNEDMKVDQQDGRDGHSNRDFEEKDEDNYAIEDCLVEPPATAVLGFVTDSHPSDHERWSFLPDSPTLGRFNASPVPAENLSEETSVIWDMEEEIKQELSRELDAQNVLKEMSDITQQRPDVSSESEEEKILTRRISELRTEAEEAEAGRPYEVEPSDLYRRLAIANHRLKRIKQSEEQQELDNQRITSTPTVRTVYATASPHALCSELEDQALLVEIPEPIDQGEHEPQEYFGKSIIDRLLGRRRTIPQDQKERSTTKTPL